MKEFIEKLIGRLEEEKAMHTKFYRLSEYRELPEIKRRHELIMHNLNKAIEIVNQLAEEYNNDFCEWQPNKQFNCFLKSPHEGVGITQEEKGLFKFCPYCGKKIKVVE